MRPSIRTQAWSLPARFCYAGNQSARRQFTESEPRDFETANKSAPAPGNLTTVDDATWAGIAGKLGQAGVILLRFQLGAESRVFFHGRAFAFIAINPSGFRHKGSAQGSGKAPIGNRFMVVAAVSLVSSTVDDLLAIDDVTSLGSHN